MEPGVTFSLVADDLVAAYRLYNRWNLLRRAALIRWAVLWAILVTVLTYLLVNGKPDPVATAIAYAPFIVLAALAPFAAVAVVVPLITPIQARHAFRQQRSSQVEMRMSWSAAGLKVTSEYGMFEIPWSHFIRWIENDHSFLLFESDRLYRVIPKRVLTPDQVADLRPQLEHIGV